MAFFHSSQNSKIRGYLDLKRLYLRIDPMLSLKPKALWKTISMSLWNWSWCSGSADLKLTRVPIVPGAPWILSILQMNYSENKATWGDSAKQLWERDSLVVCRVEPCSVSAERCMEVPLFSPTLCLLISRQLQLFGAQWWFEIKSNKWWFYCPHLVHLFRNAFSL